MTEEKLPRTATDGFDYDLIVIGSGPTGIHAAIQAAKLGKKVCVIEKMPGKIGGSWIHTGTLPSKTLRESLEQITNIRCHVGDKWVNRIIQDLNTGTLFGRAFKVSYLEEELTRQHLAHNSIALAEGYGSIEDQFSVRVVSAKVDPYVLTGRYLLVATGARPRRPPDIPFDGWRVVDSDEILQLEQVPSSMVIYGAGVVGCEYACIFAALGVQVTIIDSRSRILQYLDLEVANELKKSMEDMGVTFVLGKTLQKVKIKGPQVVVEADDYHVSAEVCFYAAGRMSTTEKIGLERLGIVVNDRGAIEVNAHFQTSIANIYAAGDAIGPPALAATSTQQGRYVACHAFGNSIGAFPALYPIGVYTIPELSMIGKTEEELKQDNVDYVVGRANYSEIARGYIRGDHFGLLKLLISRKTHEILGIHIVGSDACNLIHIGLAYMTKGGHVQDFVNLIFNYPTLAEGFRIAAFNGLNQLFPNGIIGPPPAVEKVLIEAEPEVPQKEVGKTGLKLAK